MNPYAILGIILLGLTGITFSLVVTDYYFPDIVKNIPLVNSYVDLINNSINSLSSWVSSFF